MSATIISVNAGSGGFPITLTEAVAASTPTTSVFLVIQGQSLYPPSIASTAAPTGASDDTLQVSSCYAPAGVPCYNESVPLGNWWDVPQTYAASGGKTGEQWYLLCLVLYPMPIGTVISVTGGTGNHSGIVRVVEKLEAHVFGGVDVRGPRFAVSGAAGSDTDAGAVDLEASIDDASYTAAADIGLILGNAGASGVVTGFTYLDATCLGSPVVTVSTVLYDGLDTNSLEPYTYGLPNVIEFADTAVDPNGWIDGFSPPQDITYNWEVIQGIQACDPSDVIDYTVFWNLPQQLKHVVLVPPLTCVNFPTFLNSMFSSIQPLKVGTGPACCFSGAIPGVGVIVADEFRKSPEVVS